MTADDVLRIVNTALIGIVGYIIRDTLGVIRLLRERSHDMANKVTAHESRLDALEEDVRELKHDAKEVRRIGR